MFSLDEDQTKTLHKWMEEVTKRAVAKQKSLVDPDNDLYDICSYFWDNDDIYCGAIGGRYTYKFTPTSLGNIVKVIDNYTKEELDLTGEL